MYNKSGGKVRLTFKLEQDQLWIGTKGKIIANLLLLAALQHKDADNLNFSSAERTEKVPMGSIKNIVSEPIEGHEDYHMMVTIFCVVKSWCGCSLKWLNYVCLNDGVTVIEGFQFKKKSFFGWYTIHLLSSDVMTLVPS